MVMPVLSTLKVNDADEQQDDQSYPKTLGTLDVCHEGFLTTLERERVAASASEDNRGTLVLRPMTSACPGQELTSTCELGESEVACEAYQIDNWIPTVKMATLAALWAERKSRAAHCLPARPEGTRESRICRKRKRRASRSKTSE